MSTASAPFARNAPPATRGLPFESVPKRRATLRDLYTTGLINIFRRHARLPVEPLREAPRRSELQAGE